MSVVSNSTKKSKLSGRKAAFVFAIIAAVAATILAFAIMSVVTAKETYYVLNRDVPARTLISADMLTPVETSVGGAPPSALGLSDLGDKYSLITLESGDILTSSNVGDLVGLSAGLPDNFVIGSFIANPSVAAGGNVKRGDYIDIIAVVTDSAVTGSDATAASYLLKRVLVVDATLDLDTYDAADNSASGTTGTTGTTGVTGTTGNVGGSSVGGSGARSGIPTMFTVGLSPEDAAVLAVATQYDLYVVLSSSESAVDGNVQTDIPAVVLSEIWGKPRDSGKGTDNTFGNGGNTETPEGGTDSGTGTEDDGVSTPDPQPTEGSEETTPEG